MATALKISFPEFPFEKLQTAIAEAVDSYKALDTVVDRTSSRVAAVEHELNNLINHLHESIDQANALLKQRPDLFPLINWDGAVEEAERREQDFRTLVAPTLKAADRAAKDVRRVSPAHGKAMEEISRRTRAMVDIYLTGLRDARWRVLALRAEAEKSERGPTFDDANELRRYLNSLVR